MKKIVGNAISSKSDTKEEQFKLAEFTPRETEVFNLISVGDTNREIAKKLYIVEGTVKNHVTNILDKLGLSNRAQIVIFANLIK